MIGNGSSVEIISEVKKVLASMALIATLCGCASNSGNAPRLERGAGRSSEGERFRTETLTPGVGSALFPDPSWR
jgi:hypothetical protein